MCVDKFIVLGDECVIFGGCYLECVIVMNKYGIFEKLIIIWGILDEYLIIDGIV